MKKKRPGSGASGRKRLGSARSAKNDDADDSPEDEGGEDEEPEEEAPRRRRGRGRGGDDDDDDEGGRREPEKQNMMPIYLIGGAIVLVLIIGLIAMQGGKEPEREPEHEEKPVENKKPIIEVDVPSIQKLYDGAKKLFREAENESNNDTKVGLLKRALSEMKEAEDKMNAADERVNAGGIAGSSFNALEGLRSEMGRFSTVLRKAIAEFGNK